MFYGELQADLDCRIKACLIRRKGGGEEAEEKGEKKLKIFANGSLLQKVVD